MASRPQLVDLDFQSAARVTNLPAPSGAQDAATKGYVDGLLGAAASSFETVSKNLSASGATLDYVDGALETITYANGIIKTLAYDVDGNLVTVTLSGATPDGIQLVKTLSYTSGELTGVSYS